MTNSPGLNETKWLIISECVPGHIYRIRSRNLSHGQYGYDFRKLPMFEGIRTKFSDRYLAIEYHWDVGPPHGTAKPLEDLGRLPEGEDLFHYLESLKKEEQLVQWRSRPPFPPRGGRKHCPQCLLPEWKHISKV